eukprot:TRINITY_DN7980_c0_g1_i1.p1 TRINITY_DN7980_c0_g1~~TRINITY_DN7980_c0_g1_i1.p1  ORF type:complete len:349 (+),score=33.51 TRINITY_DN7980_c0_g1_i1:205-1251(+)
MKSHSFQDQLPHFHRSTYSQISPIKKDKAHSLASNNSPSITQEEDESLESVIINEEGMITPYSGHFGALFEDHAFPLKKGRSKSLEIVQKCLDSLEYWDYLKKLNEQRKQLLKDLKKAAYDQKHQLMRVNSKAKILHRQVQEEVSKGSKLQSKLLKRNKIIRRITKILTAHNQNPTFPEVIEECFSEEEESPSIGENPLALELLSHEVNETITKRFSSLTREPRWSLKKSRLGASISPTPMPRIRTEFNLQQISTAPTTKRAETIAAVDELVRDVREPKWTPNDASKCCQICQSEFNWYRWKHHCRMCGKLVCHDCSDFKWKPQKNEEYRRICKECFWGTRKEKKSIF